MSQPYVTGPVPIFLGLGTGLAPVFFGRTERMPRIQWRPQYADVFVDIGGVRIPYDVVKQGSDAIISLDMMKFNMSVYNALAAVTNTQGTVPGDLGTLMVTEMGGGAGSRNTCFPLWMPFPYKAKAAMNTMESGYHFFATMSINDNLDQMGTVPQRKRLVFRAMREWSFSPGDGGVNAFGTGAAFLCDNDMTAVAGLMGQID